MILMVVLFRLNCVQLLPSYLLVCQAGWSLLDCTDPTSPQLVLFDTPLQLGTLFQAGIYAIVRSSSCA